MIQELLTYLVVAGAIFLAMMKLWKRFFRKKEPDKCAEPITLKNSGCGGCGANCPVRQVPFQKKD